MKIKRLLGLIGLLPIVASADVWRDPNTGIEWTYSVNEGKARIGSRSYFSGPAISSTTTGSITIPSILGGVPVVCIGDGAFENCSGLTSVIIPSSVTSIGVFAFESCEGLESLDIPEGVTNIGQSAFAHSGLKSVSLPSTIMRIERNMFEGCHGLTSVTIPSGVTSIGSLAFCDCRGLTSVKISYGVTNIEQGAFIDCDALTLVRIPESVTSIGDSAFGGCSGLTSLKIPSSVASIEAGAFSGCSELMALTISEGLTTIGDGVFSYCGKLRTVTIPSSVTTIGSRAFFWCGGLTSAEIPDGVTNIGDEAFARSGLTSVTIPSSVVNIGDSVFANCSGLNSVTISPGVRRIGSKMLYKCGVTSVTIPESVTNIGEYAFAYSPLTTAALPSSVTSTGDFVFYGCRSITSVSIPSGVANIGAGAFSGCVGLSSVTMPDSVKSLGDSAFQDCIGLKSVTIPKSVKSIGNYAFYGCTGLMSATMSEGVELIGERAFFNCTELRSVTMPSSIACVGEGAFARSYLGGGITSVNICDLSAWCEIDFASDKANPLNSPSAVDLCLNGAAIVDLAVPNGVVRIRKYAFAHSQSRFRSVTIPNTVTCICEGAYKGVSKVKSATLPGRFLLKDILSDSYSTVENVTILSGEKVLSQNMFAGCDALSAVVISEGVMTLGEDLFYYDLTKLKELTIPSTVTTIEEGALAGCVSLEVIHVNNNVDVDALKKMISESGFDVTSIIFDRIVWSDRPIIEGDEGATVTGDAETGFVIKPSEGKTAVEVSIPDGIDAGRVTVEVSAKVASVKPNGAKVKIVSGGADITEHLDIPGTMRSDDGGVVAVQGNIVIDLTKATVKEEIVKEVMDVEKGAEIELNAANPALTTAPTRVGLFYQLREGETLDGMKNGDSKVGDGQPWSPEIKVKGGNSAFYSIGVGKFE